MYSEIKNNLKETEDISGILTSIDNLNRQNISRADLKERLSAIVDKTFNWYKNDANDTYEFSGLFNIDGADGLYEFCVDYTAGNDVYAELRDEEGNALTVENIPTSNDTKEYRRTEFSRIPLHDGGYKLKITSNTGGTKWLDISESELSHIEELLTK